MRDANESSKMNSNKYIYAMMLTEISARPSLARKYDTDDGVYWRYFIYIFFSNLIYTLTFVGK